jgi:hypothetical protein
MGKYEIKIIMEYNNIPEKDNLNEVRGWIKEVIFQNEMRKGESIIVKEL